MPAKKRQTKLERLTSQKEEQKKILQEEYLRKQAEEECRLQVEAEDKKTEEERKNVEIMIRQNEHSELMSQFKQLDDLYQEKIYTLWEKENWNRYFFMGRDLNPLILQEVNAFLSSWDEDDNYNIMDVFHECHRCLKMIAEIKSAFIECAELEYKTIKSWKESVQNFQSMIRKKIDVVTFILLREANEHQNEESYNMEYGITDIKDESIKFPDITLCLWGNLSKNMRHNGMDLAALGYNFELPPELVMKDCAVRILHTTFNNITSTFLDADTLVKKSIGKQQTIVLQDESAVNDVVESDEKETISVIPKGTSALSHWKNIALKARQISSLMGMEEPLPTEHKSSSEMMFRIIYTPGHSRGSLQSQLFLIVENTNLTGFIVTL